MTRVAAAVDGDLDRLAVIEADGQGDVATVRASLAAELARTWSRVLVAREDSADAGALPVAFVSAWLVADELHIVNVATHPTHRRRGHARALLAALLDEARARGVRVALLEARASNAAAIALYSSFGFAFVGERPRYYDDGEDAVLMTARL